MNQRVCVVLSVITASEKGGGSRGGNKAGVQDRTDGPRTSTVPPILPSLTHEAAQAQGGRCRQEMEGLQKGSSPSSVAAFSWSAPGTTTGLGMIPGLA